LFAVLPPALSGVYFLGAVLDKENNLGWRKLIEYFVVGATARSTSEILNINKNTVALYFHKLRFLIYEPCKENIEFVGEVELDESYFRGSRKGRKERGAAGKTPCIWNIKTWR
jgi:transposase-like protein